MESSRISNNGQVVIPKIIRDHLNLHDGDDVVFIEENDVVKLQPLPRLSLTQVLSQLEGRKPLVDVPFEELLLLEKQSAKERREQGRK